MITPDSEHQLSPRADSQWYRWRRVFAYAVFVLYVLFVAIGAFEKPVYNWDLVAYTGCVYAVDHADINDVHALTFATVREHVPTDVYASLRGEPGSYQEDMAESPSHFAMQFAYYQLKPLYVGLLYLLLGAGINSVTGSILISAVSSTLLAILLLMWLARRVRQWWTPLAATALLAAIGLIDIARLSTPDAINSLFLFAALFVMFELRHALLGSLLALISVGFRGDSAVVVILIFAYLAVVRRELPALHRVAYALGAVLLVVHGMLLQHAVHYYGWQMHFYHSFIHSVTDPVHTVVTVTPAQYITHVVHGLSLVPPDSTFAFFLIMGALAYVWQKRNRFPNRVPVQHVVLVLLVGILIHFAIYTAFMTRFFVAQYAFAGVVFYAALERIGKSTSSVIATPIVKST